MWMVGCIGLGFCGRILVLLGFCGTTTAMPVVAIRRSQEMDAYNEFNTFGVDMDNPVAPWFANGDDENGGPDASTYFIG